MTIPTAPKVTEKRPSRKNTAPPLMFAVRAQVALGSVPTRLPSPNIPCNLPQVLRRPSLGAMARMTSP